VVIQEARRPTSKRPVAKLLRDLRDDLGTLFRQEVRLARTEVAEQAARAGRDLGKLAAAGLLAHAGLLMLLVACSLGIGALILAAGLSSGLSLGLGFAITGILAAAVGLALLQTASKELRSRNLVPRQTVESLRENKEWIKEKVS
jgi:hypothetical protein